MKNWKHQIDISGPMGKGDAVSASRSAVEQIKALDIEDVDGELDGICYSFEEVADSRMRVTEPELVEMFDLTLGELYDWADLNSLWVVTR